MLQSIRFFDRLAALLPLYVQLVDDDPGCAHGATTSFLAP